MGCSAFRAGRARPLQVSRLVRWEWEARRDIGGSPWWVRKDPAGVLRYAQDDRRKAGPGLAVAGVRVGPVGCSAFRAGQARPLQVKREMGWAFAAGWVGVGRAKGSGSRSWRPWT